MHRFDTKCLIIGAGPTGLGAANEMAAHGVSDFVVLESAPEAGGLARSFVDEQGFTWDIGGHVHFSHYPHYDSVLDHALGTDGWNTLARRASIRMHDRFIPYPIQENLGKLPLSVGVPALLSMIHTRIKNRGIADAPEDFYAWMLRTFGVTLTRAFMEPYNDKVWAHHPRLMGTGWLGDRVSVPRISKLVRDVVLRREARAWGPNATFRFPKSGGTGAIWKSVASHLPVRYDEEVMSIDMREKVATTRSGTTYRYERLMSTMPLRKLVTDVVQDASREAKEAAAQLSFSTSNIVGIGLRGAPHDALSRQSWMYFPESNAPFYRATVFSSYSDAHVPEPGAQWSLMLEVSESSHRPLARSRIVEETIAGCLATGLIASHDDVISTWQYTAPYGYPVPTRERDDALAILLPYLSSHGIDSRGRFGGWKYEVGNQDHSFMQGVEWARFALHGEPEITLFDPKKVNGR